MTCRHLLLALGRKFFVGEIILDKLLFMIVRSSTVVFRRLVFSLYVRIIAWWGGGRRVGWAIRLRLFHCHLNWALPTTLRSLPLKWHSSKCWSHEFLLSWEYGICLGLSKPQGSALHYSNLIVGMSIRSLTSHTWRLSCGISRVLKRIILQRLMKLT